MAYYQLILKGGHVGTGRYYEHNRYIEAKNTVDAWITAKYLPRRVLQNTLNTALKP